jgi:hypothetical protein
MFVSPIVIEVLWAAGFLSHVKLERATTLRMKAIRMALKGRGDVTVGCIRSVLSRSRRLTGMTVGGRDELTTLTKAAHSRLSDYVCQRNRRMQIEELFQQVWSWQKSVGKAIKVSRAGDK